MIHCSFFFKIVFFHFSKWFNRYCCINLSSGDLYPENEKEGDKDEEPDWVKNEREHFQDYRDKNKDGRMDKVKLC